MSEERLKILQMIQDGKVSVADGLRLMEALDAAKRPSRTPGVPTGREARWLRVVVTDTNTGKPRVNLRLPVNVLGAGLKMGARFSTEVEGVQMDQIMEMVRAGYVGKVVDAYDDKDGEHVEVYLE
ncbi:MAG TPA: hypothetical protein PKO03_06815 [Anaerolineaceae bacterium]|nr:hypothetical protein [Anaerolineaceae bacterium]